jgi:hypothetical protein
MIEGPPRSLVHEIKFDGYRGQVHIINSETFTARRARTRSLAFRSPTLTGIDRQRRRDRFVIYHRHRRRRFTTIWEPEKAYDVWHDRAAFHFLTEERDRRRVNTFTFLPMG